MFSRRLLNFKKHSRYVLLFKHSLPVFAFVLLSVIVAWPQFIQDKEKFNLPSVNQLKTSPDVNLERVRFFAQDPKHKKITTTADKVIEVDVEKNIIRLEKPVASYMLNTGETITARSPYGLAYQDDKYMFFEDRVHAMTDTGYTIQASQVTMQYDGELDTDSPVVVRGPAGTLNAQGVHMEDKGNLIHFKKKSTAHLDSKQGKVVIISQDGMDINRNKKIVTAQQDVRVISEEKVLTSDKIILYYNEGQKVQVDHIKAIGHVVVLDKENKITADEMIMYYTDDSENKVKSIVATGNVVASNPKNKITGERGEYSPVTKVISMSDNVVLHQGESFITGTNAWLNMVTGDSNLKNEQTTPTGKKKGRITGVFMPEEFIKN